MHVKKGDKVIVIAGKEKGKSGEISKVLKDENRVVIEGLNKMKKHTRPTKAGAKGGIVEISMSIHASNVKLADKKVKTEKVPKRTAVKKVTKKA